MNNTSSNIAIKWVVFQTYAHKKKLDKIELKLRISEILCQYSGIVEILQDAKRGTAANPISSP